MVPCLCTLGVKVNRHNTYFHKMIHLPLGQFLDVVRVLFINGESLMRQLLMENSFTPAIVTTMHFFCNLHIYVELSNCSFHAWKLAVTNTSISLTRNNGFTHNQCWANSCAGGGAITAFSINLTFSGNTTFLNNSMNSDQCLLCWWCNSSTIGNTALNFNGISNCINISAGSGGAIYTYDNTILNFSGLNHFINNSASNVYDAQGYGCAVITQNSFLMEPTTLWTTQLVLMVQFAHYKILCSQLQGN